MAHPPSRYHALWIVVLPFRKAEGAPVTGYPDGLLVGQHFGQCIVRAPFHICSAPSQRFFLQKLFLSWLGKGKKRTELDIFFFCLLDGHHVWEMEAKTDKEMCKPVSLP